MEAVFENADDREMVDHGSPMVLLNGVITEKASTF